MNNLNKIFSLHENVLLYSYLEIMIFMWNCIFQNFFSRRLDSSTEITTYTFFFLRIRFFVCVCLINIHVFLCACFAVQWHTNKIDKNCLDAIVNICHIHIACISYYIVIFVRFLLYIFFCRLALILSSVSIYFASFFSVLFSFS